MCEVDVADIFDVYAAARSGLAAPSPIRLRQHILLISITKIYVARWKIYRLKIPQDVTN